MRPRRVVAHVFFNKVLRAAEFAGAPAGQFADHVLAVAPDVVVFRVLGQHCGKEVGFGARKGGDGGVVGKDERKVVVEEQLAVVPDLVVLQVVERDGVEPGDFLGDGQVQRGDDLEAVEPDGVVRRVEGDDVRGETERARGVFGRGHDGA